VNAVAKIKPARDRYLPIARHHLPGCEGEELQVRCSILLMRDQASSSLRRCSDEAAGTLNEVQRLATLYAYAPIPLEELKELRYRLLQLTQTASGLEMFAYRLAFPEGGADAGG
jgi:hypothetical protein